MIEIYQGDDWTGTYQFSVNDVLQDITNFTFRMAVAQYPDDLKNKTASYIIDPIEGIFVDANTKLITIPKEITNEVNAGIYYYEIQVIDGDGKVRTYEQDKFIVKKQIIKP